jgi:hypothetical protein
MSQNVHRCCDSCWNKRELGREPVRLKEAREDICCLCGSMTASGIYVFDKKAFDHCEGNHPKSSKGEIPYIGFSGETLEKLPDVKDGDTFPCPKCGENHVLQATKEDPRTLFFRCRGQLYLGGASGKLVAFMKPDVSG